MPEVFTTAHDALFTQAGLRAGERLLVHGAAGGVGMAAVQLGQMAGARVTATVRNPQPRPASTRSTSRRSSPRASRSTGRSTSSSSSSAAPTSPGDIAALATGGRIAVIGIGAGAKTELDLRGLMGKRGSIHASTLRSRPLEDKAMTARCVEREVLPGFASGDLSVPVCATYPLDAVADAYERFQAGGKLGKIVLLP